MIIEKKGGMVNVKIKKNHIFYSLSIGFYGGSCFYRPANDLYGCGKSK